MNKIKVKIIAKDDSYIPIYATLEAAGADLFAAIENKTVLEPGKSSLIPTGIFLEIPKGYEVQIRPRSGLALNFQITVLNTPGTIDSDYRNEIKVILINHSDKPFIIEPKMRIAQMIVAPYFKADFFKTEVLEASLRREGFGSTGAY